MQIRRFFSKDIFGIVDIWERWHKGKFGLPSRNNVIADRVVEKGGRVVAYGMVKNYAELVMILDHSLSQREKVEALKNLMVSAEVDAKLAGIEQLQLFVLDDAFRDILIKHFGFTLCEGTALVKSLD